MATLHVQLPKELTKDAVAKLCREGILSFSHREPKPTIEASAVAQADDAGLALLACLQTRCEVVGLSPQLTETLAATAELKARALAHQPQTTARPLGRIEQLGKAICDKFKHSGEAITYFGEILVSLGTVFKGHFRWADSRSAFRKCGADAVPVVMLIGFLLGLILAFQSAIPLQMFGAEGFVGGLVGIALVRELGLIITAILMAGRTGSAFAAELGTMKVNEEIDALETMGLHPVRFLALPRILAGTFALPLLSLFASFSGLVGGWLVMLILGFPLAYYIDQLQSFVVLGDLIGSLCKAVVFGFMVAAVGCWYGLKAGRDAGAVGSATTAAVVTGIVLLAILEGLFSVLFYAMGW